MTLELRYLKIQQLADLLCFRKCPWLGKDFALVPCPFSYLGCLFTALILNISRKGLFIFEEKKKTIYFFFSFMDLDKSDTTAKSQKLKLSGHVNVPFKGLEYNLKPLS